MLIDVRDSHSLAAKPALVQLLSEFRGWLRRNASADAERTANKNKEWPQWWRRDFPLSEIHARLLARHIAPHKRNPSTRARLPNSARVQALFAQRLQQAELHRWIAAFRIRWRQCRRPPNRRMRARIWDPAQ